MTDANRVLTDSGFDRLLGAGRGIDDARVLRERLAAAERELDLTREELHDSAADVHYKQTVIKCLESDTRMLKKTLHEEVRAHAVTSYRSDMVRYELMRFGCAADRWLTEEVEHQGVWTPGRPYLTRQHVFASNGGACFAASLGGVPERQRPGHSPQWQRCGPDADCPEPRVIPPGQHPVQSGYALRQEHYWWDKHGERWALSELSREHLLGVIDWLHEHHESLWDTEWRYQEAWVPCPINAYRCPSDWLADTPLMRALLTEKRRRRIRRSPHRDPRP